MDERVASIVDDAFPDREVDAVGSTGPSWNDTNRTVRIDFVDGRTVYLKMALDGDGSRIARERAVLTYVGANGAVPVPRVVASETEGQYPYLATAEASGQPFLDLWTDPATDRATLARQVGGALANVHAIRFENHGRVTGGDEDGLELRTGPWTDVLVETIDWMREIASSNRFEHRFDEVIAAVEANRALLDDAPAALCHGDPAKPNCYLSEEGVGFFDWELSHVGDPARDLHRTRNQQLGSLRGDDPDRLVEALHAGYRDRAGGLPAGFEERRPVYEAVWLLANAAVFDKWAAFADEPADELAAWMRAEMDRRLAEL